MAESDEVSDVRIRLAAVEAAGRALPQEIQSAGGVPHEEAAQRVVLAAQRIALYIKSGNSFW